MLKIGNKQVILYNSLCSVITLTVLLMLITNGVECKDIEVTAVVSPRYIQYNEKATLELTISGKTQINHIGSPKFNFFPDFLTVPLESKTTPRLVDDKVAVTMAWVYELIPQKIGEITLPNISFLYQGIPYLANPGKIVVGATDTYYNSSTGGVHKVVAEVDTQNPYVNQRIEYRFRYLYTTVLPTVEPPTPSLPDFNGFKVEALSNEKDTTTTTKVDGRIYYVQEYVRRLHPKKSGKILIKPAELKLHLKGNPKSLKTKSIPLNVQPLPNIGKPNNFSGAIGNFSVSAHVDRKKLKVKNALTLSLKIKGNGILNNLTPPNIPSFHGFRVNPPTQVKGNTEDNFQFNYVIVPIKAGRLQVPAIEFSFFNPITRTYQITKTQPIPITVLPKSSIALDSESSFPYWTLWLLLILLVGAVIYFGLLLFRAKSKSNRGASSTENGQSQTETVSAALDSIENGNIDMNSPSFGEELTRILHQFLCNKIDEPYRKLSIAEVHEICHNIKVSQPIIDEIEAILTKCEYHRFAPVPFSDEERMDLVTRLKVVKQHLENT